MRRWTLTILAKLLACACLGAVTTVAVAWALAAWLPHRDLIKLSSRLDAPGSSYSRDTVDVNAYSRPGMVRREWYFHQPLAIQISTFFMPESSSRAQSDSSRRAYVMDWGRLREIQQARPAGKSGTTDDARGWPWLALYCEFEPVNPWSAVGEYTVEGGISLPISLVSTPRITGFDPFGGHNFADVRALPYRPIWPGFLFNTAIYAAAWLLILSFLPLIRRRLRLHRNHCPRCNYDLRGLAGCPECGWHRPS